MTEQEREVVEQLERDEMNAKRWRKIGVAALVVGMCLLAGWLAVQTSLSLGNRHRLDSAIEQRNSADSAAQQVAQEQQDTAKSISDLCKSGEVDKNTSRGRRVCEDALANSTTSPQEKIAAAKGDTGATGARGPQGAQGIPGADGAPGRDGKDGADGESIQGVPGSKGEPGVNGAAGAVGATGPVGPQGDTGTSGTDGKNGADGSKGDTGSTGAKGDTGATGAAGKDGKDGAQGERGPAGADGKDGAQGERGPAGADGKDGEDGKDGRGIKSASCSADSGRWTITYSDDTTSDGGPCLAATDDPTEAPTPTPTDPQEDGTDE